MPNHLTSCVNNFATPSIKPQQIFATPCHQFSFPCHPKTFLPPKHFSHPTSQHILPLYPKKLPLQPNKIFYTTLKLFFGTPMQFFATLFLIMFLPPISLNILPPHPQKCCYLWRSLPLPLLQLTCHPLRLASFPSWVINLVLNQFKATLRVLPL